MNDKIRELAIQAGAGEWGDSVVPAMMDIDKFAELIIKECAELGKELQTQDVTNGSEDYKSGREMGIEVFINQIRKQFGIEW